MDVYEATRARNDAKRRLEEVELEHERAMAPAIASARAEASELAEDVVQNVDADGGHAQGGDGVVRRRRAGELDGEYQRRGPKVERDSITHLPLKIRRECDVVNEQIKAR